MIKVAILGGSGLHGRRTASRSCCGTRRPRSRPSRRAQEARRASPSCTRRCCGRHRPAVRAVRRRPLKARGVQCAFGCLPHGASMESVPPLLERGIRVIDLSADYRLRDPNVYASGTARPRTTSPTSPRPSTGCRSCTATRSRRRDLVANPGCYPQTAILGLAPLVARKLIEPDRHHRRQQERRVRGRADAEAARTTSPSATRACRPTTSARTATRPEIEQALADVAGEPVEVIFTPHLIPMDRGIFITIYATPTRAGHRGRS